MPGHAGLAGPTPSRWAIAIAVAVSICLAACGGDDDSGSEPAPESGGATTQEAAPTLNTARVESALKKELDGVELSALPVPVYPPGGGPPEQSQIGGGRVDVRSVTCPADVPVERGGTFTCDVDAGDNSGSARLRQLNDSGSSLRYKATFEGSDSQGISTKTTLKGKLRVKAG